VGDASDRLYETPELRRVVSQLLALETAGAPATSETLADASGRLLDKLSRRLGQVIGPAGVRAILLRAVKLRTSEFAFLHESTVPSDSRTSFAETLGACLREQEPAVIRDASVTLFVTFTGLLANLVGDKLTWSLLQQLARHAATPNRTPGDGEMMNGRAGVSIRRLATGVPGLDDVLGGGPPELSFNLIVGGPGCGKTTMAHQIMFANATTDRPGLYFTPGMAYGLTPRICSRSSPS
jgi:hypothetical protein